MTTGTSVPIFLARQQPIVAKTGAGEGNRTLVISLEGCCSTIELHPHRRPALRGQKSEIPDPTKSFLPTTDHSRLNPDWWGRQDSNLRSHKAADLQSAPFATRDTPPSRRVGKASQRLKQAQPHPSRGGPPWDFKGLRLSRSRTRYCTLV